MSSGNLKALAREKLSGAYMSAILGMLVCYIPVYMFSLVTEIMAVRKAVPIIAMVLATLMDIFVISIFNVGYMRSLLELNGQGENKHYDANIVLSGFSKNYLNVLKTVFLRKLYTFGWGLLMLLPIIIAAAIAVAAIGLDTAGLGSQITNLIQNPTEKGLSAIATYIATSYSHIVWIVIGASVASLLLSVLYIRKVYLYEMIPIIMAQTPDMPSKEAFAKTKEIMTGYRFRYFILVLSFMGLLIASSFIVVFLPFNITQYIAMALVMPYMNMTILQFYLWRLETTERND